MPKQGTTKTNLLGLILIKNGLITEEQLETALELQKKDGGLLGEVLVALGYVSETSLAIALSAQIDMCFLPLERYRFSEDLIKLIPGDMVRKYLFIPVEKVDGVLTIVSAVILEKDAIHEIEFASGHKIVGMLGLKSQIMSMIHVHYKV